MLVGGGGDRDGGGGEAKIHSRLFLLISLPVSFTSCICAGILFTQPNNEQPSSCPCEGLSYITYSFFGRPITFFDALQWTPPGCYLAPAKDVQENFRYLQETYSVESDAWVGVWKEPSLVRGLNGNKILPADKVNGWVPLDNSPWHVTTGDPLGYWQAGEPNNDDSETDFSENVVTVTSVGKMVDKSPTTTLEAAYYKCCYDICDPPQRFLGTII
jgi:hypothetical protein